MGIYAYTYVYTRIGIILGSMWYIEGENNLKRGEKMYRDFWNIKYQSWIRRRADYSRRFDIFIAPTI